jgi:ribosomal protein S18 acetylase RimI-like enzyme
VSPVTSSIVSDIEEALVGHWSLLGRWPRGALVEEGGTTRYETPIAQLPYNGVIRTRITGDAGAVVERVLESYSSRGVSCLWWHHPSATPVDLGRVLAEHGLSIAEVAVGMSIELESRAIPPPDTPEIRYAEVLSDEAMGSYSELVVGYWEVPAEASALVEELNRYWGPGSAPAHRWLALDEAGRAVGKGLLSLAAPPGIAAIYGMSVRPEARGKGIASALTNIALGRAKELGCRRVVLHSSEMAVGVYERAGFTKRCEIPVYANAMLWASRQH